MSIHRHDSVSKTLLVFI